MQEHIQKSGIYRLTKEELAALYADVMEYARGEHVKLIDDAYEYFWEEDDPTELMGGQALELALLEAGHDLESGKGTKAAQEVFLQIQ